MQAILDILAHELEYLIPSSRIFIYNQEFVLEPTEHPWVIVKQLGSKAFSNQNSTYTNSQGNYQEEQYVLTQDIIVVTIISKNIQALQYKEAIPMALASIYSEQRQDELAFKISRNMQCQDLSELEGGSINYRFDWTLNVLACYQLIKKSSYFDTFTTQLIERDGVPINKTFNPRVLP